MLDLDRWLNEKFFSQMPICVSVIDKNYNIVRANETYEKTFGSWKGRKFNVAYKNSNHASYSHFDKNVFTDGKQRQSHQISLDKQGKVKHFIKQTIPIQDDNGEIPYLAEIWIDVTGMEEFQDDNELLFEQVPCNMTVLDSNLNIIKANKRVKDKFGDVIGKHCYEIFLRKDAVCKNCPAQKTLHDGKSHTGHSVVRNSSGEEFHFQITTSPFGLKNSDEKYVLEMAINITELKRLETHVKETRSYLETAIAASMDGIVAVDENRDVTILNSAARRLLNLEESEYVSSKSMEKMLPKNFYSNVMKSNDPYYLPDSFVNTADDKQIPARLVGAKLETEDRHLGIGVFLQDQRKLKELEKEKLESERMAAVGQTVAGLAHGIKNLVTGLDGGMYMMRSGIRKDNKKRIDKGWAVLERNVERISSFVREFLSYSKGRTIIVKSCNPVEIAKEVIELFKSEAKKSKIKLSLLEHEKIPNANMDYEGIHESLVNLVGNSIDACKTSERKNKKEVTVHVFEENSEINYMVIDNGEGMAREVMEKAFRTYFSTKGQEGTGLGLLVTKKIIQEHGGHISVESELDEGSTFTIHLPRKNLPEITVQPNEDYGMVNDPY